MKVEENIKKIIADHIGVSPDEIELDDDLREDLHMGAAELSELILKFDKNKYNLENLDLTKIATVSDLVEAIGQEELL